jgi:hypothetical protein
MVGATSGLVHVPYPAPQSRAGIGDPAFRSSRQRMRDDSVSPVLRFPGSVFRRPPSGPASCRAPHQKLCIMNNTGAWIASRDEAGPQRPMSLRLSPIFERRSEGPIPAGLRWSRGARRRSAKIVAQRFAKARAAYYQSAGQRRARCRRPCRGSFLSRPHRRPPYGSPGAGGVGIGAAAPRGFKRAPAAFPAPAAGGRCRNTCRRHR